MNTFFFVISGIVVFLALWSFLAYLPIRKIEKPGYKVIRKEGNFEIRHYDSYIVASVKVKGPYTEALNQGFRLVAGYIFGGNEGEKKVAMTVPVYSQEIEKPSSQKGEKISMTAPVLEQSGEGDSHSISFTMPSSYTMETLPIPSDKRVTLHQVPPKTMAVLSFKGFGRAGAVKRKKDELKNLLKKSGLTAQGAFGAAYYNPPLTPPFMRHNEVMVEVEG